MPGQRAGNRNFEDAIKILKGLGLAKDGAATAAGTPRTLADLARFVYLSDAKMTGLLRLVTPVMTFFARRSIKNGRLNAIWERYCRALAEQVLL